MLSERSEGCLFGNRNYPTPFSVRCGGRVLTLSALCRIDDSPIGRPPDPSTRSVSDGETRAGG
jgi:hypothetical protein